ncbi:hypothetical protein BC936DRAFT_149448 [Jimgerdemannia flammicorona]|uniref:Uncharacterized protein n=2 Tax=Jimgerdemannia flammicorona TaxID=994334 RepID=A0A433D0U1_9FUNG|nr:hypothetical protein BC936DRAFT_149448 [Jimgerdemannia flammicorona]RUS30318.1 hypothetical protein BC938DRAFT_479561 [Jimgerdemannia flammicorona]
MSPVMATESNSTITQQASPANASNKDITAKDIANLYSRLQAVIETVREPPHTATSTDSSSPRSMSPTLSATQRPSSLSDPKNIPLPASPTTSTRPLPNHSDAVTEMSSYRSRSAPEVDCACRHILVSVDSKHCSLCDRVIPIVAELQKERLQRIEELETNQLKLREEARRVMNMTRDIQTLKDRIEDLEYQLDTRTDEVDKLKADIDSLNEKYIDEIARAAEIQHSKDMVENELEDLSRKLFEEANGMVAHEKREKYDLQVSYQHLQNNLKVTQEQLVAEQMQLQELREKMGHMVEGAGQMESESESLSCLKMPSPSDPTVRAIADIAMLYGLAPTKHFAPEPDIDGIDVTSDGAPTERTSDEAHQDPDHLSPIIHTEADRLPLPPPMQTSVDELMLNEFKEFITTGTTIPLKKIHTIPFMKNCLVEDIETCLRFGPAPRVSARKITDAIVTNTCFIEEAPLGFAEEQYNRPPDVPLKNSASKQHLWERFSGTQSTVIFRGCQACGRIDGPLPFRFRISHFDDWACIDRYCRDRLVAVCEFYVFIRNVRQGYYANRTPGDLYAESIRLRLQMFYARMGALPSLLQGLGLRHDSIGSATIPTVPTRKSYEGSARGSARPSTEIVPEPSSSSTMRTGASVTVTPSTSVSSRSSLVVIDPIAKDLPAIPIAAHTE